jgi:hypothetical protein
VGKDFTIRAGRKDDAAEAARLWMRSAEEHTAHDRIYETAPGAEKTMRRFLVDVANSGYSFLFVAAAGDRTVGFISGALRQTSDFGKSRCIRCSNSRAATYQPSAISSLAEG